jgi:hypothetical protein
MAEIKITIPDALLPRVINGLAAFYGYQVIIDGQPNPQTKGQFAKAQLIEHVKHCVKQVETDEAVNTARVTKATEIENDITLS